MKKRKQLGRVTVIAVSTALMATSSGVAVMAEAESNPTEISNWASSFFSKNKTRVTIKCG